jgi:8-oxo-dGTP pyrophosphatase MutT (NUDIX family)
MFYRGIKMKKDVFENRVKKLKRQHHILGKDLLRKYAVFVALVELNGAFHFIFEKRAKGIRQPSEISFPGGAFDPELDKSFLDTALRESCEELGIELDQIEVITQVDTFVSHVYIENFLGVIKINHLDELNINKDEVEYVFTIPVQTFIDTEPEVYGIKVKSFSSEIDEKGNKIEYLPVEALDLPERYHNSWHDNTREVYVYRTPYGTLWGITALIVYETIHHYLLEDRKDDMQ